MFCRAETVASEAAVPEATEPPLWLKVVNVAVPPLKKKSPYPPLFTVIVPAVSVPP